jgi:phage baseplate assembly protein W
MAAKSTLDRSFLGRGWAFPPRFGETDLQVAMVDTEQDIAESLHILLRTRPGERIMHPTYGCRLHWLVFEVIQDGLITDIRDMIERAIVFFEPRIELEDISIDTEREFEGVLEITIDYRIRSTNTRSNIVYPFYFKEGTHV